MKRRSFLQSVGAGAVATFALQNQSPDAAATGEKPNLLVIHTDEHNFRTLGCYRDTLSPE